MKKLPVLKSLAFFGAMILLVFACSFTSPKDHSAKDNYKNIIADDYPSVIIGSQEWMTENLNVDKFRNGDPIPEAQSESEWKKAGENSQPAWCYYNNNSTNGKYFGKLYNWYAVNDPRGLSPEGWHVPSDKEWTVLTDYLGGEKVAGGKLTIKLLWLRPHREATNSSGFSGLPGGGRSYDGDFSGGGNGAWWWSSSMDDTDYAWVRDLSCYVVYANRDSHLKDNGLSVRCLKD